MQTIRDFCERESRFSDWSSHPIPCDVLPQWEPRDEVRRLIESIWQMPTEAMPCVLDDAECSLQERFREQADKWDRETAHHFMTNSMQSVINFADQ